MTRYKRISIGTSKSVCTLHGVDEAGHAALRSNLRRAQTIPFFMKLPATGIVMEACGGAHHWARELTALGHEVRIIPAQYVKPFMKRGKNDRNDAEAICEAAGRPGIHPVPVKTAAQQAQGMVLKLKLRETLIGQRVQLTNALRGHAAEFGIVAAMGDSQIGRLLSALEQDAAIPPAAQEMFVLLGEQIEQLNGRIKQIGMKLNAAHKASPVSMNLATAPGIGPVVGLTIVVKVDPDAFWERRGCVSLPGAPRSGRQRGAWGGGRGCPVGR